MKFHTTYTNSNDTRFGQVTFSNANANSGCYKSVSNDNNKKASFSDRFKGTIENY